MRVAALRGADGRDVEICRWPRSGADRRINPMLKPLADDLRKRFPEDTFVTFSYLPVLRALSCVEHRPAVQSHRAACKSPLPTSSAVNRRQLRWVLRIGLHSVYVRGEAYLAARKGGEAVREFQKILDHRGIVVRDPIGALAHVQLGRAFALSGDQNKAKAAYQDFLTLWKDADPDIPILRQAKAEYAKLQ